MQVKAARNSMVLWFNYGLLAAALLAELVPVVQLYLPGHAAAVLAAASMVNILLRYKTNQPLTAPWRPGEPTQPAPPTPPPA